MLSIRPVARNGSARAVHVGSRLRGSTRYALLGLAMALTAGACGSDSKNPAAPPPTPTPPATPRAATITVTPPDSELTIGTQLALAAVVKDSTSALMSAPHITWSSADTTVAKVSDAGVVSAIALGMTRITVSVDAIVAHVTVGVFPVEGAAAAGTPALHVDAGAPGHAISPLIYGMSTWNMDANYVRDLGITAARWGGDATTRYNWMVDASNAGGDWYFMAGSGTATPTPGASVDALIARDHAASVTSLITIPLIDYVNKMSAWSCTFPTSKFGAQQSVNPYVHPVINGSTTDCGNGRHTDGSVIPTTSAEILAVHTANSATLQKSWVTHLVSRFGAASAGGVGIYLMDNEPSGWSNTHRDVRPISPDYAELLQRTITYGSAVKSADPSAKVAGPEDFGWAVYVGDPTKNGGQWNAIYYLQQLRAYEQQHGTRLLDYFTEHWYPSPDGVIDWSQDAGTAAVQAARLRSTRTMWDSTYREENWIGQWYPPVALIPTFHKWVSANYPGTKIGITEYNWGGQKSMNGALAQADLLGIFGREALDVATLWSAPDATWPAAFAFRLYRNYDGQGSRYGDYSVPSTSGDQTRLAIYGATRAVDGALTMMVINKTATDLTTTLSLAGVRVTGAARRYRYSGTNLGAIARLADRWTRSSGYTETFPASSITLIVLPSVASGASATRATLATLGTATR